VLTDTYGDGFCCSQGSSYFGVYAIIDNEFVQELVRVTGEFNTYTFSFVEVPAALEVKKWKKGDIIGWVPWRII
jgi:hypothetical protein